MNEVSEDKFGQSPFYKKSILFLGLVILMVLIANFLVLHRVIFEDVLALVAFIYFLVTWKEPVARVTSANLIFGSTPLFRKSILISNIKSVELLGKTKWNMKISVVYDENGKQKILAIPV